MWHGRIPAPTPANAWDRGVIIVSRYLDDVKARLAASACIAGIEVITERLIQERGYFRARLRLVNGDFLELSEYFVIRLGKPETLEYRYQWMDAEKQRLIRRWDNARHSGALAHPGPAGLSSLTRGQPGGGDPPALRGRLSILVNGAVQSAEFRGDPEHAR